MITPDKSLKLKYRNPDYRVQPDGTMVWRAQSFKANPGSPGNGRTGQFGAFTIKKGGKKVRPRKRAYGPF